MKNVSAAKAMGNFTGWTFAAVNAIASEVANIQLRLYQINSDEHEEQEDHPLLTLLQGVNEHMTGIEFTYTMMAHLEPTGNFYCRLDGVKDALGQGPHVGRVLTSGLSSMAFVIGFTLAAIGCIYAQSGRWKPVLAFFNNDAVGIGDTRELKSATTYLYSQYCSSRF